MRAEIDENGKLTVTAETPTERFALSQWWEDFNGLKKYTFAVVTVDDEYPRPSTRLGMATSVISAPHWKE